MRNSTATVRNCHRKCHPNRCLSLRPPLSPCDHLCIGGCGHETESRLLVLGSGTPLSHVIMAVAGDTLLPSSQSVWLARASRLCHQVQEGPCKGGHAFELRESRWALRSFPPACWLLSTRAPPRAALFSGTSFSSNILLFHHHQSQQFLPRLSHIIQIDTNSRLQTVVSKQLSPNAFKMDGLENDWTYRSSRGTAVAISFIIGSLYFLGTYITADWLNNEPTEYRPSDPFRLPRRFSSTPLRPVLVWIWPGLLWPIYLALVFLRWLCNRLRANVGHNQESHVQGNTPPPTYEPRDPEHEDVEEEVIVYRAL